MASPATVARNAAGGRIAAHVWGMRSATRRGRRGRTTVSPWATASAVHDEMSTAPYPWKRAGIGVRERWVPGAARAQKPTFACARPRLGPGGTA